MTCQWARVPARAVMAAWVLCVAPAWAQRSSHWQDCTASPLDRSIAACTAIIKLRRGTPAQLSEAYNKRGVAYAAKHDLDRALADYDQAVRLDPKNAAAYSNRGAAYALKHNDTRALADFDQAIRLNPKLADAWHNRGEVKRARGDTTGGDADLARAHALDPRFAEAPAPVATREQGEWCLNEHKAFSLDQQIRGCTAVIAAARSDSKLSNLLAMSYALRGHALFWKKMYDAAIADFDQAIRLNPKDARSLEGRGLAYGFKGDRDRAIADLTAAIENDANFGEARFDRGLIYLAKENYADATADFTEAIRLDPKSGRAVYSRGVAHLERGEVVEAEADIARAFDIDPNPDYRVFAGAFMVTRFLAIPATAKSWPLTAKIEEGHGSVFVFTRGSGRSVRFDGAESTKDVPMNGPVVLIVSVPPSAKWQISTTIAPNEPTQPK